MSTNDIAHTHCHSHLVVAQLYKSVINDTISSLRTSFLDEGVDDQVLHDLKQMWLSKLSESRAITHTTPSVSSNQTLSGLNNSGYANIRGQNNAQSHTNSLSATGTNHATSSSSRNNSMVPIQITIPSPSSASGQSAAGAGPKVLIVQVPLSAVNSGRVSTHLHTILSSPAAQATLALPAETASTVLQRQLNEALCTTTTAAGAESSGTLGPAAVCGQTDGTCDAEPSRHNLGESLHALDASCSSATSSQLPFSIIRLHQNDGLTAFSDSDSDILDDVDVLGDDYDDIINGNCAGQGRSKHSLAAASAGTSNYRRDARNVSSSLHNDSLEDLEEDLEDNDEEDDSTRLDDLEESGDLSGQEEEPLNSGDDVSDVEASDLQEAFNVMVCEYDKITRIRNRWRFHLKDGVMNLDGKDFIFQKATGEAEW